MRLLNGLNPWSFARSPDEGYDFRLDWDDCDAAGEHDLVNVSARFEIEAEHLLPRSITLAWRLPGHTLAGSPTTAPRTFTPQDGDAWAQAKRILRVSYSIAGELDTHLAQAHLNVEQYAMAAWRNLRHNPIAEVLLPHLREVIAINRRGDHAVFGRQGVITQNSAITAESALHRMTRRLGHLDWTGWRPSPPICATHTYAKVANLYWEVLVEHFRAFFAERGEEIGARWIEVRRFSDDLVAHSVPWAPDGEPDEDEAPRARVGGRVRAVRPVTTSDAPAAGDLDRLEQLCCYVVFHATLYHTWENDMQEDDGGDLRFATLGLHNGSLAAESDPDIAPTPAQASSQLYFAHTLACPTRGHILANEDGDVHPGLVARLKAREREFAALGYPADRIRSRINI